MPPRFAVTPEQIDQVVAAFYAAVRRDAVLGPVFADKISNWAEHEHKITAFWRNAILYDRGYAGNPMQIHVAAGSVRATHFPVWLGLFDQTLEDYLSPDIAAAWSALAHRIGAGLRYGVEMPQQGGVPNLTA